MVALNINLFVYQEHVKSGFEREFVQWLSVKQKYLSVQSVMKGYNNSKAEREWGISRLICKTLRDKWIKLGWCEVINDNADLKFIHQNNTRSIHYAKPKREGERGLKFIQIGVDDNATEIFFGEKTKKKYVKKTLELKEVELQPLKSYQIKILKLEENVSGLLYQFRHELLKWTEQKVIWVKKMQSYNKNMSMEESIGIAYCGDERKFPKWSPCRKYPVVESYHANGFFLSLKKIAVMFRCSISMAGRHMIELFKRKKIYICKEQVAFYKSLRPRTSWKDETPDVIVGAPGRKNYVNFDHYHYCNSYFFWV